MSNVPRKIMQESTHHKSGSSRSTGTAAVLLLGLIIILSLFGCSDETKTEANADSGTPQTTLAKAQTPKSSIPVGIDTSALVKWIQLAKQEINGDQIRKSEYEQLLNMPAYTLVREAPRNQRINAGIMQDVMHYVFAPDGKVPVEQGKRRKPKRAFLLANYEYAAEHLEEMEALIAELQTSDLGDRILARLKGHMSKNRMPKSLMLRFNMATNMIYALEDGTIYIDAGLALAIDRENLPYLIAADIYRGLSGIDDSKPNGAPDGRTAMKLTFRQIRMEGIASWLGNLTNLSFDKSHATLSKTNSQYADLIPKAKTVITQIGQNLDRLLDPERDLIESEGASLDEMLHFGRYYPTAGFAMAALIADRNGADGLAEVSHSTADFLKAYQEAALGGKGTYELGDLPPFPEPTYTRLLDLITRP